MTNPTVPTPDRAQPDAWGDHTTIRKGAEQSRTTGQEARPGGRYGKATHPSQAPQSPCAASSNRRPRTPTASRNPGGSSTTNPTPKLTKNPANASTESPPVSSTHASAPSATTSPAAGASNPAATSAGTRHATEPAPRTTRSAASAADISRPANPAPRAGTRNLIRSARNVRQSPRTTSHATTYQRRPVYTSRCGSASRSLTAPPNPSYTNRNRTRSRDADATSASTSASTVGPRPATDTVADRNAANRPRNRAGNIDSTFASARNDVSSIPVTVPDAAACKLTATATTSSSSSSNGGIAAPAPNRYPPAVPVAERTSYPKIRNRSTSLRTVRVVTPNRPANSAPDHTGRACNNASNRNNRTDVSNTHPV